MADRLQVDHLDVPMKARQRLEGFSVGMIPASQFEAKPWCEGELGESIGVEEEMPLRWRSLC